MLNSCAAVFRLSRVISSCAALRFSASSVSCRALCSCVSLSFPASSALSRASCAWLRGELSRTDAARCESSCEVACPEPGLPTAAKMKEATAVCRAAFRAHNTFGIKWPSAGAMMMRALNADETEDGVPKADMRSVARRRHEKTGPGGPPLSRRQALRSIKMLG